MRSGEEQGSVAKRWLKTSLIYLITIPVVAMIGIWAGTKFGLHKAEAQRAAERQFKQVHVEKTLRGIEIGKELPDVEVLPPNGTTLAPISGLLPHGGLLVVVSAECTSCPDALVALGEALHTPGVKSSPVLVVARGDKDAMDVLLSNARIKIPIFRDTTDALVRKYGVGAFPTCFLLDSLRVVGSVLAGLETKEEFLNILF